MNTSTVILTLAYLAIFASLLIGAYKWLKHLAAEDKLFVCLVPTNEVVGIRRGGTFHRFLFDPTDGTHLNDPRSWQYLDTFRPWERIPNSYPIDGSLAGKMHSEFKHVDERNWFTRMTGIYFFLPFVEEVDMYPFDWTTYLRTEIDAAGKKTHVTKPHTKPDGSPREIRSVYAKVVQYYGQSMVLTQDGIEVLVNFTFDVDLTNPFVARFARGNFLGQVKSRLEAELRNYIGDQTFSQLFSEDDSKKSAPGAPAKAGGHGRFYEGFVKILNAHVEKDPESGKPDEKSGGIETLYGVTIKAFHILDIQDPTGHSAKQVEARQKLEIAKQGVKIAKENADAKAEEGEGIRRHDESVNAAKVRLEKELMEIRTLKPEAVQIAVAEALFSNAQVVSLGKGGIKPFINLDNLKGRTPPTTTATAPAAATTTTPAGAGTTTP